MSWIALDIGGANLKAADGQGYADSRPFALWRTPERLADELAALLAASPRYERVAVTMTGELADCFETKASGVIQILEAVETAAAGRFVTTYATNGAFLTLEAARETPLLAAASNWRALAQFACRFVSAGTGLLVDLGSTTADVIPLSPTGPTGQGIDDPTRLLHGELVYTGVERTPVCAVVERLPWRGQMCPVAAELFATTADAYLILGDLLEERDNLDTADGRPRTWAAARARLAHMVCADASTFSDDDAQAAARTIADAQVWTIKAAIAEVVSRLESFPATMVISGHGEFLLERVVNELALPVEVVSLSNVLGPAASRCAPAHALAVLAREQSWEA